MTTTTRQRAFNGRTGVKTGTEGYLAYRHVRNLAGLRTSRPNSRGAVSEDRDAAMRAEAIEVVEKIRADERAKVLAEVAAAVAAM
jgi:hypothetical protein